MVTIGVVAGVIVAAGTIATGLAVTVNWIFRCGRQAEREEADRAKMAADLDDLKRRLPDR